MSYFFNPSARVEHLEHVAYYQSKRLGLGARYIATFDMAMSKICKSPQHYKKAMILNIHSFIVGETYTLVEKKVITNVQI